MGADQGDGQGMDLGQQFLVALVVVDPCADVVEEVEGDVDGSGAALDLVGQVPAGVQFPVRVAAAGLAAAALADLRQAGGQQRLVGTEPGQPGPQPGPDLGRVVGDAHGLSVQGDQASRWYRERLIGKRQKNKGAKKKVDGWIDRRSPSEASQGLTSTNRCKNSSLLNPGEGGPWKWPWDRIPILSVGQTGLESC